MLHFDSYFSAKTIIRTLCKYRIKHAKKKHKYHLLRDISLHDKSVLLFQTKQNCPPDLKELFPSRRAWLRPNLEERKRFENSQDLRVYSLYKTINTIHIKVSNEAIEPPEWYVKLQRLIKRIQQRAANPESFRIKAPTINPIKKNNAKTCEVCRPISLYDLEDRLLIRFTAKYLTDLFDPFFADCSYAFRSTKAATLRTHHDTIARILTYKAQRPKSKIYAAEADLEKFFDTINHKIIYDSFEKFSQIVDNQGGNISSNAKNIFYQYLASYTFNEDVLTKNDTDFFIPFNIHGGKFEWPIERLSKIYSDINSEKIGVPQGGALSCLIANLVLHDVDEQVELQNADSDLLYLRFCDDMLILHTDYTHCTNALNRYEEKLVSLNLLMHPPEFILEYDKQFWKAKSKRPYRWGSRATIKRNVPWLGFVGYQIRYDGIIRVRKKSLEKEASKQKDEMKEVLNALYLTKHTSHKINEHSRKSKKQQIFALKNRLISMSVGRVQLYDYKTAKNVLCWTNGFKCIDMNFVSRSQCRYLDRSRYKNLKKFGKSLSELKKPAENPDEDLKKIYFGHPYSYHGFLKPRTIF